MKNNLKIDGISIVRTDEYDLTFGTKKVRESEELIQHGHEDWSILVYSKEKELTEDGLSKLKRLLSLMIWERGNKTEDLRKIKKNLIIDNNILWKSAF